MPNRLTKKGSGNIDVERANGGYKVPNAPMSPPAASGNDGVDTLTKKGGGQFTVERSSGGYKTPKP